MIDSYKKRLNLAFKGHEKINIIKNEIRSLIDFKYNMNENFIFSFYES